MYYYGYADPYISQQLFPPFTGLPRRVTALEAEVRQLNRRLNDLERRVSALERRFRPFPRGEEIHESYPG